MHAARLVDGRDVVVKVRKPGVDTLVRIDLEILAELIDTWAPRLPGLNDYDAKGVLREFSESLLAELDYRREAANERFFRHVFANEPGFSIPDVIAEFSTGRVLTHERVEGAKSATSRVSRPGAARPYRSASRASCSSRPSSTACSMPIRTPGNLLIGDDGSLAVVDFGTVGRLTPEARRRVAGMFLAISRRDAERLTDRLIEVTAPRHPIDRPRLTSDIERLLEQYVDVSFDDVPVGNALGELLHVLRRHQLRLPANLAAFIKALIMCEGILQALEPESSLSDYLQPMAGKLVYQGIAGGDHAAERLRDSALDAAQLSIELPRRIDRVLGRDRARKPARVDPRRGHRPAAQAARAHRRASERDDPRGGMHRRACDRLAALPPARMAAMDRRARVDRAARRDRRRGSDAARPQQEVTRFCSSRSRSASTQAAPAIANVSAPSLQFV